MANGDRGFVVTNSLEGIPLISVVEYAQTSGWAAAVGLPVRQLEAPLRNSLVYLSITGVLVTVAALALAFLVARVLHRGFLALDAGVRRLDEGEVVEPAPSIIREVSDVNAAMVQVSRNLFERNRAMSDLTDSLENQVQERSADLVEETRRREESEQQLRQLQRIEAIGKLTGGIAHDFNNMLAVIIGGLSLTKRHLARGDAEVGKYIDSAMQGAESAANLTRRLLAFSRQQALSPQAVDCNRLINGMSDIFLHTIPEHIEIETVLAGGLWRTWIDMPGLENAILNLVVNGRDAMPGGGKLTIETCNAYLDADYAAENAEATAGQYVMIAITDTGTGIPPDVLDKVFEPFFTTKEPGQGTGLGLSQVHGFIKQSGGHVRIHSEAGYGTTVKLYLPRLDRPVSKEPPEVRRSAAAPLAHGHEKVLVVEDEEAVRHGTVAMLEELGYVVVEASGGAEALEALDREPDVALLITDVVMPGMNGRQLAAEATRRLPGLRVLYATGYTRNAIVHQGTLDPGVHLIAKPYTIETLAARVQEVLAED
ncbi:MAG: response regulator [Alphaproteobacteria bacterium]|nr:response regulator [Alphaproteobacteria bacterium]